jgi:hypothetical protein
MKRLITILVSLGSFLILSLGIWKIKDSWGLLWAVICFIPLIVTVSIVSGIIFKSIRLEDRIGPIAGLAILTGILGTLFLNPLQESFLFEVDARAQSILQTDSGFKNPPGYINLETLALCEDKTIYQSIRWDLVRRGMKMKDADNRYYGYDAAFPLRMYGETKLFLYFETVGYGENHRPSLPTEKEWEDYCKKKVSWVKILKDPKNRNAQFVRKSFPNEPQKLIYVDSSSPRFGRWAWSIGFGILILLNLAMAIYIQD